MIKFNDAHITYVDSKNIGSPASFDFPRNMSRVQVENEQVETARAF